MPKYSELRKALIQEKIIDEHGSIIQAKHDQLHEIPCEVEGRQMISPESVAQFRDGAFLSNFPGTQFRAQNHEALIENGANIPMPLHAHETAPIAIPPSHIETNPTDSFEFHQLGSVNTMEPALENGAAEANEQDISGSSENLFKMD